MAKHIHADLMLQYAQDAQESETPWENWEYYRCNEDVWATLKTNPVWQEFRKYRRKPKTIVINGFTVNAPMDKEPGYEHVYFCVDINSSKYYESSYYKPELANGWDKTQFLRGLCFSNKEDAIAMAKAILRLDPHK